MPGTFFELPTYELKLDDENTVTVRRMTYGERQAIIENSMHVSVSAGNREEININAPLMQRLAMYASIVSWSGPGFGDTPVSKEAIDRLPVDVAERIWAFIDGLSAPLNEAEKKA